MAEYGYNRVINELSWDYESVKLTRFYDWIFLRDYSRKIKPLIPRQTKQLIPRPIKSLIPTQTEPVFNG
jgi:hypothetical protein